MAIRRQREVLHLSQKQLGVRLKTSQPRVAKIERAASDVSMDQLVRALHGGRGQARRQNREGKATKGKRRSNKRDDVILEVMTSK